MISQQYIILHREAALSFIYSILHIVLQTIKPILGDQDLIPQRGPHICASPKPG